MPSSAVVYKPNEEQDLYITMVSSTLSAGEEEMVRLIGGALIAHVNTMNQFAQVC